MSTLLQLLATNLTEWPEYDGKPASTICQSPNGTLWINDPNPSYPPEWREDEWASDFIDEIRLTDVADEHKTAIITKEMWEQVRVPWHEAPADATHYAHAVKGENRAAFYKKDDRGQWLVWMPVTKVWAISVRLKRQAHDLSFLIPRPGLYSEQAPDNDVDNW